MAEEQQKREDENNEIKEMGTLNMKESGSKYGIQLLTIIGEIEGHDSVSGNTKACLLYTSPSPRDLSTSRMPSSA